MNDLRSSKTQIQKPHVAKDHRDSKFITTGPWTAEEDRVVVELVQEIGPQKWTFIASHLPGRIGKQCRERWHNHLNPNIRKEDWHVDEEWLLFLLHKSMGNSWAEIAKVIRGRTDNSIKNHWNSSMKKQLAEFTASYERYLNLYGHYEAGHSCKVTENELAECVRRKRGRRSVEEPGSSMLCTAVYGRVLADALSIYRDHTDRKVDKENRMQVYAGQVQETNFLYASFSSTFKGLTPVSKKTRSNESSFNPRGKALAMMATPEHLKSPMSVGSFMFESPSKMLDLESSPLSILRF